MYTFSDGVFVANPVDSEGVAGAVRFFGRDEDQVSGLAVPIVNRGASRVEQI